MASQDQSHLLWLDATIRSSVAKALGFRLDERGGKIAGQGEVRTDNSHCFEKLHHIHDDDNDILCPSCRLLPNLPSDTCCCKRPVRRIRIERLSLNTVANGRSAESCGG
jgi:hypothetical protein